MKKALGIIFSAVIIAAAVGGAYFVVNSDKETTTAPASETSSITQATEASTAETTTETTTESTTAETTTAIDVSSINKGYWYVYDDEKTLCCVLRFKGGEIEIAQFDESNIVDEDPEHFKGSAGYSVSGNKITLKDLPKQVLLSTKTLEVKDGKLYYNGKACENHDDIRMSYIFNHFE